MFQNKKGWAGYLVPVFLVVFFGYAYYDYSIQPAPIITEPEHIEMPSSPLYISGGGGGSSPQSEEPTQIQPKELIFNDTVSDSINLLQNSNFTTDVSHWGNHGGGYVTWDDGTLHFTPNDNSSNNCTTTEAWQGRWNVSAGDLMIFEGWFKAGSAGIPSARNYNLKSNIGTGFGIDLRTYNATLQDDIISSMPNNPSGVFYTFNCPATINQNWTYIMCNATIPCIANADKNFSTWSVSSGVSGTGKGARMGLWYMPLVNQPMPKEMYAVVWLQIWHHDTIEEAWIDNLKFSIIRNATQC